MKIFEHNSYHFIGIGGIGISAIARMLLGQDKKVTGSDSSNSEITDDLQNLGIKISIGEDGENIGDDVEVVIYTIAIKDDNKELVEAKNRGILCVSYPQALGELSKEMFTIAISGTHGKTTTTAMIGHILGKAKLDPTIIVGSKMLSEEQDKNSNFHAGTGKYLVVEACEYKRSFLNLTPQILIITNIDTDHLDYYKDLADIQSAFLELILKVPKDGYIITDVNNENIAPILKDSKIKAKILDYKGEDSEDNIEEITQKTKIRGAHNILNVKSAIKAVEILEVNRENAIKYLGDWRGTWRRLEYKGEKDNNIFYDDYAHHPAEIKASLMTLRETHPDMEIVCVFEPHQELRTKLLFDDFVQSLKLADRVFIAPIYINKEVALGSVSNQTLSDAVSKFVPSSAVENVAQLKEFIRDIKSDKPLCIALLGAGNIYKWTSSLL